VTIFGGATRCGRPGNFDAAAIRFQPDGALDPSFGVGGRLCLNTTLEGENLDETAEVIVAGGNTENSTVEVRVAARKRRTRRARSPMPRAARHMTRDPAIPVSRKTMAP
jgi:hypothetical protein